MLNHLEKNTENIYQCKCCKAIYYEPQLAIRPLTNVKYCRGCQSEEIELVKE